MKPVIKWVGGKTQLLDKLIPLIPKDIRVYYEPFVGGAALYLSIDHDSCVINDINPQISNLYKQIKDNLPILEDTLENINSPETDYYLIRDKFNECLSKNLETADSAAYLIYLNKHCFNGLYRVNRKGLFNVPYNHKYCPNFYDHDNLVDIHNRLQNTAITNGDFEEICKYAIKGDFIFFDSPYYNTFDTYQPGGFSEADHIRLANLFKKLTGRGVKCLLTNSNEDFIKNLYKDYNIMEVDVKRNINCDGNNRKGSEVIITNYMV